MKKSFLFLLLYTSSLFSQPKLLSWNLENLGKSKSEGEITFIANTVKDFDIVALQEVVACDGGAQAVARLADELNYCLYFKKALKKKLRIGVNSGAIV